MKLMISIFICLVGLFASAAPAPFKIPPGSRFVTEQDDKSIAYAEPLSFRGALERSSDFRALESVDLFEFPGDKNPLTVEKCRELVAKILGPEEKAGYKITKNEIIKGTSCDTRVNQTSKYAYVRQRTYRVKRMNGKLYAVEARFEKPSRSEEDAEFAELFDSLK